MKRITTEIERKELLEFHHEIRTPLNIVLGFVQILYNDNMLTKHERKLYLKIMQEQSIELIENIDLILNAKN